MTDPQCGSALSCRSAPALQAGGGNEEQPWERALRGTPVTSLQVLFSLPCYTLEDRWDQHPEKML